MYPSPFLLERFFARHEFSARYLLSASDCQGPSMAQLVTGADEDLRVRWDDLRLGYTESQGLPELREEIAGLYGTVGAQEVLVAAPEEAVFLTMHALLGPGDHVICTFPGYQSLYELARSIGCEVELWRVREEGVREEGVREEGVGEEKTWRFDPGDLETMIRPDTKLVVWNFPHNPTGALPSAVDYSRMVAAVARTGAWVFSDEMYRLLEPRPDQRLPPAVDLYDRAISLAGMSKAFGLAGLRIGWVTTRDGALLQRMQSLKDYTTICSSAPSELLALMALRSRETILTANLARIERNLRAAGAFFARHRERFTWVPPQAGTVCFPGLTAGTRPGDETRGLGPGADAFCARLLEKTGALLLPSTVYSYDDAHFRLGFGRDDFQAGLEVVEAYLAGRWPAARLAESGRA